MMSHTETQEVTYLNGHRVRIIGKVYAMERTCSAVKVIEERVIFGEPAKCHVRVCSECGAKEPHVGGYCHVCGAKVVE